MFAEKDLFHSIPDRGKSANVTIIAVLSFRAQPNEIFKDHGGSFRRRIKPEFPMQVVFIFHKVGPDGGV